LEVNSEMEKTQYDEDLKTRLAHLRQEHSDLDSAIHALEARNTDQLQLSRLKRQKLRIKEEIVALEDTVFPDIIA